MIRILLLISCITCKIVSGVCASGADVEKSRWKRHHRYLSPSRVLLSFSDPARISDTPARNRTGSRQALAHHHLCGELATAINVPVSLVQQCDCSNYFIYREQASLFEGSTAHVSGGWTAIGEGGTEWWSKVLR